MYAECFPTILILSKEEIPEESIPIENCYQFLDELELAQHLKNAWNPKDKRRSFSSSSHSIKIIRKLYKIKEYNI